MSLSLTKKKKDSQKEEHIPSLAEDMLIITEEREGEDKSGMTNKPDLSYLNQPTLIVIKNRKKIRKKIDWAILV
jgi:hypothetical protein